MSKLLACVFNTGSGSAKSKRDIKKLFNTKAFKIDFLDIKLGEEQLSRKLKDSTYKAVIAAGGDGTVRLSAQLAIKAKLPLGVLPVGTLNHFAKDLNLPMDLEESVNVITRSSIDKIDYCTVNDVVFVNNASIGIYPETVLGRSDTNYRVSKILATIISFTSALFTHKVFKTNVNTPSGSWTFHTSLLFVGNNKYHIDKPGFTNRQDLKSGKMFVYVVRANRRRTLILIALLSFFGKRSRKADFIKLTKGPVGVESKRSPIHISLDGEIFKMGFPLQFQTHPAKLQVFR